MKKKLKIKLWFRRHQIKFGIFVMLLFPIVIGGIYAIPLPQIIAIDSGDLIAYYGAAFGILGSFAYYRIEKAHKEKERNKELTPVFSVIVERNEDDLRIFKISIQKISDSPLMYMHLYDEFVSASIEKNRSFNITYCRTIEELESIKPDYNITMDDAIIDADGYPKYVQILCDDIEGNSWNCCYYKIKDCNRYYYYPRDLEIL